jgi:hypothetical protein
MDRIPQREKPPERTSKSTGKAGPRTWEREQYIYKKEPKDDTSHGDPRLEFALQNLSLHQHLDSDVIPSDEESDHESLHPAFGFGATPELSASDPSASDQGTLAGGALLSLHSWNSGTSESGGARPLQRPLQRTRSIQLNERSSSAPQQGTTLRPTPAWRIRGARKAASDEQYERIFSRQY